MKNSSITSTLAHETRKNKKGLVMFVLVAMMMSAVFVTSCNEDKPVSTRQIAVNLRTDINPASILKLANDQFETKDKVGLFMKKAGVPINTADAVYSGASNREMSISDQMLITNPPVLYPESGNVDFIAYYPYPEGNTNCTSFISDDYSVRYALNGFHELLYSNNAVNQESTELPVMLNFRYVLAKLDITVTGGENSLIDETGFTSMRIGFNGLYSNARLQLADGTLTDKEDSYNYYNNNSYGGIRPKASTSNSATFETLVIPISEADGDVTFNFIVGGITYQHTQTVNFEASNLYKLNFALDFPSTSGQTVTLLNASITPRTENDPQYIPVDTTQ